jgi:hypothetical protein
MRWKTVVSSSALALGLFALPASAAPITGVLNILGSAVVTADTIDWAPDGGATGTFVVSADSEAYFDGIEVPFPINTGDSLDLPAGPFPVANFLSNFTTPNPEFDDLSFTLEGFDIPALPVCGTADGSPSGIVGDETGETCVAFAGSPFSLTVGSNPATTDVGFNVFGSFVDLTFGDDGSLNNAIGLYTTNISDLTPIAIQSIILAGGSVEASYSAEFNASAVPVPEPVSLSLTGFGLAALAYRMRRRRQS